MDIELSFFHSVMILFININPIPLYNHNKLYFVVSESISK